VVDSTQFILADWKGEACVAPRATCRTGRDDPWGGLAGRRP